MGAIYKNSIKYSGGGGSAANERELTQAEYDLLTPEEKMNGTNYFITDGEGGGGSGGGGVPTPTTADIGKVLTVNDNVNVAWGEASGGGADLFTVNFLDHSYAGPTPMVHSKDKTFAEIKQAIDEGKTVIGIHTSIFPTGQTTEGQSVTIYVAHQLPYTGGNQKVIIFTAPISLKNTAQSAYCDTKQVIMYTLEVKEDETFTITNGAGYLITPYYDAIGKFLKYDSYGTFNFESPIPSSDSYDAGKVLTVNSSGTPIWGGTQVKLVHVNAIEEVSTPGVNDDAIINTTKSPNITWSDIATDIWDNGTPYVLRSTYGNDYAHYFYPRGFGGAAAMRDGQIVILRKWIDFTAQPYLQEPAGTKVRQTYVTQIRAYFYDIDGVLTDTAKVSTHYMAASNTPITTT